MKDICVRCLQYFHKTNQTTRYLGPHLDAADAWWQCIDETACDERQVENRARHQQEIEHRLKFLRSDEHLLVILDWFGHRHGYGNYYVSVDAGADPMEVWAEYKAGDVEGALVLGPILKGRKVIGDGVRKEERDILCRTIGGF